MSKAPIYRCSGKGCGFATDDLEAFVRHVLDEKLVKSLPTAEPPKTVEHKTVRDYLSCPECYPKFESLLLARGWKRKTEKGNAEKQGLAL